MRYRLKNVRLLTHGVFHLTDVLVSDGRIVSMGDRISCPADTVSVDLHNAFLFPGFVDVHVHLREPGFSYKETIRTGTMAAAHGGFAHVAAMPNLDPVPDCAASLAVQRAIIERDALVHVHPYGAITVGEKGEQLADLARMAPDVIAFSDDGRGVQSESMMRQAMEECRRLGKTLAAHCEDNALLRGGYIHDGAYARTHGHRGICSESEWGPIARDLKLAEQTGCAYHVCHVSTKESVGLIRAAKRRGIPMLVIDHSTGYMPMGNGLLGACGRLYEQIACRLVRGTGAPFYGVSAAACRWLHTFGITAAGTMPNAIDPAALEQEAAHAPDWRAKLNLGDRKIVLFVGRLIPEKGAGLLAQAVAQLPGVVLVAAGSGPQQQELADLGAVTPGALPHDAVVQLLRQADVYCLPTRYAEGFPTTLLEAAACRCPIVCTRTAGTEELLPDDTHGIVLPGQPQDATVETIRAGLQTLLDNPARAHACAEAAYRNVYAHFTWDAVFDKMMGIINQS